MAANSAPLVSPLRLDTAEHVAWLSMRQALWMGSDSTTAAARDGTLLTDPERFGAIAYDVFLSLDGAVPTGFIEVSLRDDLDAFGRRQVGYVEGVYVEPSYRGEGTGRALIGAAAEWTISKSVKELVADVLDDNPEGLAFHERCGFRRVGERLVAGKRQVLLAMIAP